MHADVALLDLRLRRRLLIGLTLGVALTALAVVALYPQFKNSVSFDQLSGSSAAALFGVSGSLTSPAGWLNGNLYQNFLPLAVLIITISYGASCIAGQDEDGTLSLVATLPVRRRGLLRQKVGALAIQAAVPTLAAMVCVIIGRKFEVSLDLANVLWMSLGLALLGFDFGLLALALGSWRGSRGLAAGVAASLAVVSYLVSSLAPVVHWLRPARYASLFYWSIANGQFDRGLSAVSLGILLAVAAALVVVSAASLERLDLH
jgi:beta-exotoxin I transport system permease protein